MDNAEAQQVFQALYRNSVGWISAADTKATTLLGFTSGMLAAISFGDVLAENAIPLASWLAWLFFASLAISMFMALCVLKPVTDRGRVLKSTYGQHSSIDKAWSYYADAASITLDALIFEIRTGDSKAFREQEWEQAYIVALIAHRKMWHYRVATNMFFVAFTLFVILLVGHTQAQTLGEVMPCR